MILRQEQGLSLTHLDNRPESHIFALISTLLLAFRDSGFPAEGKGTEKECPVSARVAPVGDFFTRHKGAWVLNSDSLPNDFTIKSIAINKRSIMVETSPVNWEKLAEAIEFWSAGPFFAAPEKQQVVAVDGKTVLANISQVRTPPYRRGLGQPAPRVMWTIPLSMPQAMIVEAAHAVDLAYGQLGVLESPDEEGEQATASGAKQKMKLDIGMRPMLEQTPYLSLEMRTVQELQFAMLCQQARHLARMPEELAMGFVQDVAKSLGTGAAFNLLLTSLSQRVKDTNPGITWKQARAASRRMLAQIAR